MRVSTGSRDAFALGAAARARLERHAKAAVRGARRHGRALAAVTVPLPAGFDPAAIAAASRRPGEPWFVLEQPDSDGAALAALGCVAALEAGRRGEGPTPGEKVAPGGGAASRVVAPAGPDRFAAAAREWRALASRAAADTPDGPPGCGPVALGGFAFADDGGAAEHWTGFAPASLHVPEVSIARRGDDVRMTAYALASPDDTAEDLLRRVQARLGELRAAPLPLLDPNPALAARVASAMPPEHYVGAVERAVERIRAGDFRKIVLAREVLVRAGAPHDPAAIHGVLREAFPSCFVFCVGRGDSTFIAASPELLVRRQGLRASTLALAGTTRRSADPAVDDHLGEQLMRSTKDREEQAIVIRRIERLLRPHSVWVAAAEEPVVVRMANVQHLATPIRAQLRAPVSAIELAGALHPTPAVGGEPLSVAGPLIPALEGFDRGWYAGPVGWTDANEDGELCVALRSALLRGSEARCYAGVGVVRDSDSAAELAETEAKLQALLPVLT